MAPKWTLNDKSLYTREAERFDRKGNMMIKAKIRLICFVDAERYHKPRNISSH